MHKLSKPLLFLLLLVFISLVGCSSSKTEVTSDDPETAFRQAKANYDRGNYTQAIEDFSFLEIKFARSEIRPKVIFYLAQSYYKQSEYMFAIERFNQYLSSFSTLDDAEEALFMYAMSNYRLSPKYSLDQEFTEYAITSFQDYLDKYPTGKYSIEAVGRLNEMRDKLAFKIYESGILYMKMERYNAAATYFEQVRERYIDSQWADDALAGQIEAYIRLNRTEDARRAIDRFYQFYPASPLRARVDRLKSSL